MKHLLWTFVAISFVGVSCTREIVPLTDAEWLDRMHQARTQRKGDSPDIAGEWHFDFQTVRAYRMNWEDEDAMETIVAAGKLNETREPRSGIALSTAQVERLQSAVTGTHPELGIGLCLYPHHGFVFFDENDDIVGSIDVCFLCESFRGNPRGFAGSWNLVSIAELIHDLGMPLRNPDWE